MSPVRRKQLPFIVLALASLAACGGGGSGGSSSSGSSGTPSTPGLTITTPSLLPGTLRNHAYSTTLSATGGRTPYRWSIAPISATASFVDGLSVDANTGVVSGTANFGGTGGFTATVTDSGSPALTATKSFTITAADPLTAPPLQNAFATQYQESVWITVSSQGGVQPITYSMDGGCLPPGIRSNIASLNAQTSSGVIAMGDPYVTGVYQCQVTIQDSFSPPEVVSLLLTVTVTSRPLELLDYSLPSALRLDRPFSGYAVARGGTPPYFFEVIGGSPPPGISLTDVHSGQLSGTPTALGFYIFEMRVTDSASPPQSVRRSWGITVSPPLGRNDSPATATPIGNGSVNASISPYIDPPDGTPAAGDNDFYKLVSLGGAAVHVFTFTTPAGMSSTPLDTVLEIVDGNGMPLNTCRQPGDTSANFSSPCVNDDISSTELNSALDCQVPGATNVPTTLYVHVLDWRGDARPDMSYALSVSGLVPPLTLDTSHVLTAARGATYSGFLTSTNGSGAVTWTIDSGAPPPGITLASTGSFSGSATVNGTYPFTVRATDSGNPPQTATAAVSIEVVDPLTISSPATWPDACQNQFYSFTMQTSGGAPPLGFVGFASSSWPAVNVGRTDQGYLDGVFTGTPDVTGTFTGTMYAKDATGIVITQTVTLTVKACP